MAEPDDSPAVTVSVPPQTSTYGWLCHNPLASSCGTTLCSLYEGSKNYNRVTKFAFGTVESAVTFAAGTARPVVGKVAEKLDRPITAVDGIVADQLVKLGDKYPVLNKDPGEIYSDGKEVVCQKFQSGQATLSNTRAATWLGYGVDCTLSVTENLVEHFLPACEEKNGEEYEEEEESEEKQEEPVEEVKRTKSRFGLRFRVRLGRKKKNKKQKEDSTSITSSESEEEGEGGNQVAPLSRTTRIKNISYTVYHRSLCHLQAVQEQCRRSLEQLRASLDVLQYAQLISSGAGKQYHNAQIALKEAEARLRKFLSRGTKVVEGEEDELCSWIVEERTEDKDIAWLMGEEKKDLYQRALDYAKWISERIYQSMQSVSKVANYVYLPRRLREGAETTLQQARNVYTTLKLNNVPSELPSFLLAQISEVVETQINYCRQLGGYINSAVKKPFWRVASVDDAASQGESDEEEEEEGEDGEPTSVDS